MVLHKIKSNKVSHEYAANSDQNGNAIDMNFTFNTQARECLRYVYAERYSNSLLYVLFQFEMERPNVDY